MVAKKLSKPHDCLCPPALDDPVIRSAKGRNDEVEWGLIAKQKDGLDSNDYRRFDRKGKESFLSVYFLTHVHSAAYDLPDLKVTDRVQVNYIDSYLCKKNKFVRTKMRLKEGTKVKLQRFSIFCQICSYPLQKLMLAMKNM